MITANQIRPYKKKADGFEETEKLKHYFFALRRTRNPFYLNPSEFDKILRWKLRGQYNRTSRIRNSNTEEIVKKITSLAFNLSHKDKDYELELRIIPLTALRGVGIPVASAILALIFPESYAVIDFRVWRRLFGEEKRYFTMQDYKRYLVEIRRLSSELGWLPQEVDLAIWAYDMESDG